MSLQVNVTGPPGRGLCGADNKLLLETSFGLLLETGSEFVIQNSFRTKVGYAVAGVSAQGVAGEVDLAYSARVFVTGVAAQGLTGTVLIWNQIVPGDNGNWSVKPDDQDPGWQPITPGQLPSWTDQAA
jgi:hypothetical protein